MKLKPRSTTVENNKNKAAGKTKTPRPRSDLENFKIHTPSDKAWKELIRDFRLAKYESELLRLIVEDMVSEVLAYQAFKEREPDRKHLRLGLDRIEKAFAQLEFELDRFKSSTEYFLPHDFSERLGDMLNFSIMSTALNDNVFPRNFDSRLDQIKANKKIVTMEAIELEFSPNRKALGLKHGHKILPHVIKMLHAPLKNWLELDRLNRGGRPRHAIRQFMIERIAHVAPEVVGVEITTNTTNPAFELCNSVLSDCGIPEAGLDKSIAETFRKIIKSRSANISSSKQS